MFEPHSSSQLGLDSDLVLDLEQILVFVFRNKNQTLFVIFNFHKIYIKILLFLRSHNEVTNNWWRKPTEKVPRTTTFVNRLTIATLNERKIQVKTAYFNTALARSTVFLWVYEWVNGDCYHIAKAKAQIQMLPTVRTIRKKRITLHTMAAEQRANSKKCYTHPTYSVVHLSSNKA